MLSPIQNIKQRFSFYNCSPKSSNYIQKVVFNGERYETFFQQSRAFTGDFLSKKPLTSIQDRLWTDPMVLHAYGSIIKSLETQGFIEDPPSLLNPPSGFLQTTPLHYSITSRMLV